MNNAKFVFSFSVRPVGTRPGGPDGLSVNPGADLARTRSLPQPPLGKWITFHVQSTIIGGIN